MNISFNAEEQLRRMIEKYPNLADVGIKVDLHGILLDYIAVSGFPLIELLNRYEYLYRVLFPANQTIPSDTKTLLEVLLRDAQTRSHTRVIAKQRGWEGLINTIDEIDRSDKTRASVDTRIITDHLAKHHVECVVWQLSDIHFGSLNALNKDARTLAGAMGKIARDKPEFVPRLIVVSGDITSCATESEFEEFLSFCEYLSEDIWGGARPWRFLVVPGNHEATWLEDGTADKLSKFKDLLARTNKVVTPFWTGRRSNEDSLGRVTVESFQARGESDTPPFALVHDKEADLRILLLVSPYFSGCVPEPARLIFQGIKERGDRDYLMRLLREDTGRFSEPYIAHIDRTVWSPSEVPGLDNTTTIAVTHHNPYQYATEICQSPDAPLLLQTLASKGVHIILHGHVHFAEDLSVPRLAMPRQAYPVPCPALGGIPFSRGGTNGFMLHMFGPAGTSRKIASAIWMINHLGQFDQKSEHLRCRYRFVVDQNRIVVRNVSR